MTTLLIGILVIAALIMIFFVVSKMVAAAVKLVLFVSILVAGLGLAYFLMR